MQIIRELKHSEKPTSTALGFFDGVHRGHIAVIGNATEYARQNNLVPTVFTMLQSPREVLTGKKIGRIITLEEKLSVFEKLGVQQVYLIDFCSIKDISAEDFINKILIDCFNAKHAVCGFNYHFGSGGSGDGNILHKLCEKQGVTVTTQHSIDFNGMPISSTRIRQSIAYGDITSVNEMLGHEYGFCLPVIHGRQLGRNMGTPTLNQRFPEGLIYPSFGVYASAVNVGGALYCGVTNVGIKPTVGSDCVLIETWMPDYNGGDLYGESIDVRFIAHIRAEKKFDGIESLKNEIIQNSKQAETIFRQYITAKNIS